MDGWSIILTFNLPQQLYMAQSLLEAEGIATEIRDADMALNGYGVAVGGAKLLVRNADYETAYQLLKASGYFLEEREDDSLLLLPDRENKEHCPFCNSSVVKKGVQGTILMRFVIRILAVFLPLFRANYYCGSCKKRWKYLK